MARSVSAVDASVCFDDADRCRSTEVSGVTSRSSAAPQFHATPEVHATAEVHATPYEQWLADDPEVAALLDAEARRQCTTLQLIASENFTSLAVLAATGSVLTNKYAEGYPGRRYYGGNAVIDEVEDLARSRAISLFGAEHANVQPHAGAAANLAVYQALLEPGDTVLAMRLDQGGHLTHGSPASITSKIWRFVAYGVTPASDDTDRPGEVIDFDQVADVAKRERPRLIVAGATAYPRVIAAEPFREIALSVGARLMFDVAHPAGLIAGGVHPSPVGIADVVTLTTHKTLRGPRGGAILCGAELAKKIDSAVFPGLQGGPLEHVIAAKAVAFGEAARPEFAVYASAVVANARALAAALAGEGFRLVSGGTDNHLVLVDLRTFDAELTGKEAQEVLDRAGITLNRNTIPDDPRSAFVTSGLRLGTAAQTTAGMGPDEMARIAVLVGTALRRRGDDAALASVRGEVLELCTGFPPYPSLSGAGARGGSG
jgi:glycine hydroxymethyltransferase